MFIAHLRRNEIFHNKLQENLSVWPIFSVLMNFSSVWERRGKTEKCWQMDLIPQKRYKVRSELATNPSSRWIICAPGTSKRKEANTKEEIHCQFWKIAETKSERTEAEWGKKRLLRHISKYTKTWWILKQDYKKLHNSATKLQDRST